MQDPRVQDRAEDDPGTGGVGRHRAAGAPAGEAALDVVRSEEQLVVGRVSEAVERVRVHRDVVVEQVTRTFEVRREVLRIERTPLAPGAAGAAGTALGGVRGAAQPRVVEVVLREERPVVSLEVVPVERVRLSVVPVDEVVRVDEQVRVERVEIDTPGLAPRG